MWISNKKRLIQSISILLTIFLIFALIVSSYIKKFENQLNEEHRIHLSETTNYISAHMTTVVSDTQGTLKAIAMTMSLLEKDEERYDYLDQIMGQYSFTYMGFAMDDGMLHTTVEQPHIHQDINDEDYFKKALQGESMISNLKRIILNDSAISGVLISVPMNYNGVNGVVVAMIHVSDLSEILTLSSFNGEGYYYIVDHQGDIVLRTKSLAFGNIFTSWENVEFYENYNLDKLRFDIENNVEGITAFNHMGVKKYAYYKSLPFNDWSIISIVSQNAIAANTNRLSRELTMLGGGSVLLIMFFLFAAMHSYSNSQESKFEANAKSAFLANMSHEIRTPMNAIVGISEMLSRGELSEIQKNQVSIITSSAKALLTIINDILDLSKIQAGKFTIVEDTYELESLLYDVVSIAAIRIGEKPIKLIIEPTIYLPRVVVGDMGRVKQILLNIVGNAIKFTDEGSIIINVDGKLVNNKWELEFAVKDTGVGMKQADIEKCFAAFTQVDINRNRSMEGTGLGLSISENLCKMMEGYINVTSVFGKGSIFTIHIKQKVFVEKQKSIGDFTPLLPVVTNYAKVLIYDTCTIFSDYAASFLTQLQVEYKFVETPDEFENELIIGDYTHALSNKTLIDHINAKLTTKTRLLMLLELKEQTSIKNTHDCIFIPLFSFQFTLMLCDAHAHALTFNGVGIDQNSIEPLPYVNILVVDDSEVNVQVAEGLMQPYQMSIEHAYSGEDALNMIKQKDYDLIFMDHMMPGMDGVETVAKIRELADEKYRSLPIIALSANATVEAKQMFLKTGFQDFVSKPIETYKLDKIIKFYLEELNDYRANLFGKKQASNHSIEVSDTKELEEAKSGVIETSRDETTICYQSFDIEKALKMFGNVQVYQKILKTFVESSTRRLNALIDWFENDHQRLQIEVHGLKGAAAAICAQSFADASLELENLCKAEEFDAIKIKLSAYLKQGYALVDDIKQYLQGVKPLVDTKEVIYESSEDDPKKHIAIVDDNPVNLETAEAVLKEYYNLSKLTSGDSLLEFLKFNKPDLILLDIQMPDKDGYEVLQIIESTPEYKEIPVIFLTGQSDIMSERKGFKLGAKDFITKPFDPVIMLARIKSQLELYAYQNELESMVEDNTKEIADLQHMITLTWAEIIESRDGTTGSHVRNTNRYYKLLLEIMGNSDKYKTAIENEDMEDLLRASSLHDIGKIGISDLVLKKPGPLDKDEFTIMKEHARIGGNMIQKIISETRENRFLLYALNLSLHHHERWDGSGYPEGLIGEEIPLYVCALTISDVFDALTAERPYKKAFTFEDSIAIMEKERGKFYNPELLDLFLEHKQEFKNALMERIE